MTIDALLERITIEHPDLMDYPVPSIQKAYFGDIDVSQGFFDSFREDYRGFDKWFIRKAEEVAYVCRVGDAIEGFLYLKRESEREPYSDIKPTFAPKRRLKIGTFKVSYNGFKIGERFLKIMFDNALQSGVDEIYSTIFVNRFEQIRLVNLLCDYGFSKYGIKISASGQESVYVRNFSTGVASKENPKCTFPFMSRNARKFIVPIYPQYHTSLFPDSILRTETPMDFVEHEPFRNAISKAYISRSFERRLCAGDIILFYRTGGLHKSVVTTLGIVEGVTTAISDVSQFKALARRRSVFSDNELEQFWNAQDSKPFIVNFLYAYSLPRRPNLARLIELGVIRDVSSAPRGFERMSEEGFDRVITESRANKSLIVD